MWKASNLLQRKIVEAQVVLAEDGVHCDPCSQGMIMSLYFIPLPLLAPN